MKDLRFRGSIGSDTINVTLRCDTFSNTQDAVTVLQVLNGNSFSIGDSKDDVVQKYFAQFLFKTVSLKALKDHATTYHLDLYAMNTDDSSKTLLVNGDLDSSDSISAE